MMIRLPLLLAVSDNGAQMIAASTRRFMVMVAIAQHFGRPATPTNQAWIKSLSSPGFCGGWFIWCRWLPVVIVSGCSG